MVPEKTVGPSTVLFLAGIKLDTCKLLKSLIVWLNFICSVVVPGHEEHFSGE